MIEIKCASDAYYQEQTICIPMSEYKRLSKAMVINNVIRRAIKGRTRRDSIDIEFLNLLLNNEEDNNG